MKLGLIADIHENVGNLQKCLERLEVEGVDRIVMLGDVFELGHRIGAPCEMLANGKAGGVRKVLHCTECTRPRIICDVWHRYEMADSVSALI